MLQLIRAYHDKYLKLIKPFAGRQNDKKYQAKIHSFREDGRLKLFDIAACKCVYYCHCKTERKVPIKEQLFLRDQRTLRVMYISTVDKVSTKKLIQLQKRKADEAVRTAKYSKMSNAGETSFVSIEEACDVDKSDKESDSDDSVNKATRETV